MDGTALYECVAVLFIAQVLGASLDLGEQFIVVVLALLTSIGVAGIPSASLVAIVIIVHNVIVSDGRFGVSAAGADAVVGLLFAVDRLLDMSRTAVNVFSDCLRRCRHCQTGEGRRDSRRSHENGIVLTLELERCNRCLSSPRLFEA